MMPKTYGSSKDTDTALEVVLKIMNAVEAAGCMPDGFFRDGSWIEDLLHIGSSDGCNYATNIVLDMCASFDDLLFLLAKHLRLAQRIVDLIKSEEFEQNWNFPERRCNNYGLLTQLSQVYFATMSMSDTCVTRITTAVHLVLVQDSRAQSHSRMRALQLEILRGILRAITDPRCDHDICKSFHDRGGKDMIRDVLVSWSANNTGRVHDDVFKLALLIAKVPCVSLSFNEPLQKVDVLRTLCNYIATKSGLRRCALDVLSNIITCTLFDVVDVGAHVMRMLDELFLTVLSGPGPTFLRWTIIVVNIVCEIGDVHNYDTDDAIVMITKMVAHVAKLLLSFRLRLVFCHSYHELTYLLCRLLDAVYHRRNEGNYVDLVLDTFPHPWTYNNDVMDYLQRLAVHRLCASVDRFKLHEFDPSLAYCRRTLRFAELCQLPRRQIESCRTMIAARRTQLGLAAKPETPDFCCPITLQTLTDPVVASDGHTYEKSAIQRHLLFDDRSPLTREVICKHVYPNVTLRKRIRDHLYEEETCAEKSFWNGWKRAKAQ